MRRLSEAADLPSSRTALALLHQRVKDAEASFYESEAVWDGIDERFELFNIRVAEILRNYESELVPFGADTYVTRRDSCHVWDTPLRLDLVELPMRKL